MWQSSIIFKYMHSLVLWGFFKITRVHVVFKFLKYVETFLQKIIAEHYNGGSTLFCYSVSFVLHLLGQNLRD